MKNKWLYLSGCFVAPHIMLLVGIMFVSMKDAEHKYFGLRLCQWSTIALVMGSLAYYIFVTPLVGVD